MSASCCQLFLRDLDEKWLRSDLIYVGPGSAGVPPWLLPAVGIGVWLVSIGAGMSVLWRYKNTPGALADAPADWPADARITRAVDRPTLVMFAHPHCPCTRATMGELARLMTEAGGRVDAHVLFLKPREMADGWERTDLWRRAESIPDVRVVSDVDGREAARFGATVSGQVLLYDPPGRLLFRGGITGARGHEGGNTGRSLLAAWIRTGNAPSRESRVFGCSLVN
jgi:hypothetical protein